VDTGACLIDTNILVRWVLPNEGQYASLASMMGRLIAQGNEVCYTPQAVSEFWNVCTRPINRNGYGMTPAGADGQHDVLKVDFSFCLTASRRIRRGED
jgi:hypothetical protein